MTAAAADPSLVGSIIAGKYRLDEELGRGGMGAVYRAYHLRVHKEFALKVLLSAVAEHRSIASRFLLEAQAAGRIGHPGILDVYDVGEDADGTPFIVMELLRGEALSTLVQRERVEVDAACFIAMQVLDVLEAAHRAGIIHRDVKPQNVFITERPSGASDLEAAAPKSMDPNAATPPPGSGVTRGVKLLDFGIAKFGVGSGDISSLTRSGEIIGSPLYMAPEQAKGEADLDARADVWSVGAMLFEMLTGKCAHAATTPVAVLAKILTEPAPAPSTRDDRVPPELDAVVERALKIDRSTRFASAQEMRDALGEVRKKLGTENKVPFIPPAAKRTAAPLVSDHTPGAITSTVAASSEPSRRRPWSSPVPRRDAVGGVTPDAEGPVISGATELSPAVLRWRARIGAGVGLAAVAIMAWYMITHNTKAAQTNDTSGAASSTAPIKTGAAATTSTGSATANAAEPPPSSSSVLSASSTSSLGSLGPPLGSGRAPFASSSSPEPSRSAVPVTTAAAGAPAPKCAPGEVLSKGHCCARGLEWQGGHCERPLATTF